MESARLSQRLLRQATWWLLGLGLATSLAHAAAPAHAVVFMYHRFGEDRFPSTSVRLAQFDAHLDHLASEGFNVWPVSKILDHFTRGEPIPERTVAITIDDAYLSVYAEAYPRLRARGWPFTVFVASDPVDQRLGGYMSWEQMREMRQHGVSFANHSASHAYLVRRAPDETNADWLARIRADIQRGARRLREELGETPALFAYPYGEYDTALANLVRELGYVAFGQHSGAIGVHSDRRALPRFPMAEAFAAIDDFKAKARMRALPVAGYAPWDPVIDADRQPTLTVTLADDGADILRDELTCYVSGQGRVEVQWLDERKQRFAVRAPRALPDGRSRYNCTAPDRQRHYYWFSQQWVTAIAR